MKRSFGLAFAASVSIAAAPQRMSGDLSPASQATIFATMNWSEWCAPEWAFVDLQSGRYEIMSPISRETCRAKRIGTTKRGSLGSAELSSLKQAYSAAVREGLVKAACLQGRAAPDAVVTNAIGPYVLLLAHNGRSMAATQELGCWTGAANGLHRTLEQVFKTPVR
jgi:hypothetical protein